MSAAIRQDSPEWESYRQSLKGIGASDAAAALGIDPYRSAFELWEQQTGRKPPSIASKRMERGKRLEAVARAWTAELVGKRIVQVHRTVRDGRWPHLFCHPDGRVVGESRLVQIKTRYSDFDELPLHVEAQVQMEMALTGAAHCTLAVMTFEDLYLHELDAEPLTAGRMLDRLEAWYVRHVIGDEPPRDDSDEYRRWLGGESPEGPARDATADELALIERIREARRIADSAARDEAQFKSDLMESMRGTSELLGEGFTLTWRRTKDRTHIDWPSIAAAYRALINRVLAKDPDALGLGLDPWNAVGALESIHTNSEPGTRPFRLVLKGDPR